MKANMSNKTLIAHVGWYPARHVTGVLDMYEQGGMLIDFGMFKPKYVVNAMISDGYIGVFDVSESKLKVYAGAGTEARPEDLVDKTFDMILME